MMVWKPLISCLIIASIQGQRAENEETDSPSSRRILGSSVVTSVSVVMETGNGKHTYYSDAVGHPLSKPHIASQVASPINLLNPDRYEFYTFNDDGELVKRLMTLEEIQGIIAGGDGEASNYNSEFSSQMLDSGNDVSDIVENVQNVLKEEIEAHRNPASERPVMDTPDVSANWNLILPAFFGNEAVTPNEDDYVSVSQKYNEPSTTERLFVASRMPPDAEGNDLSNEYNLPVEVTSISAPTEPRINESSEKLSTIGLNATTAGPTIAHNKIENSSELPLQTSTNEMDGNDEDIITFDAEKIRTVTQEEMTTTTTTTTGQKITNTPMYDIKINLPIITERVNVKGTTIDAQPLSSSEIDELPNITELLSMITEKTTATATAATTTTMETSSVTFPPSTQFTHYQQITQSSSLEPVSNDEENDKTSDASSSPPVNDNFVILSLDDNKNDFNLDVNNTTTTTTTTASATILSYMPPENITSNVEQVTANVSNDDVIATTEQNYIATNLIEELLSTSTMPSDFKNNIVTFVSSFGEPSRTTVTNAAEKEDATTPNMQKISTSEMVPEATRNNIVFTTKLFSRPISTTTTSAGTTLEENLQKFSTFSIVDVTQNSVPTTTTKTPSTTTTTTTTTTTPKAPVMITTTNSTKAPITTTTSTKAPIITTTTTSTKAPIITTTTTSTKAPIITTTTSTKAPIKTTTITSTKVPITTEDSNKILVSTTQTQQLLPSSVTNTPMIKVPVTSEETLSPILIANRFAAPASSSNTENDETITTTQYTKISQSTPSKSTTTSTTTTKETTESLKQKPTTTSTHIPTTISIPSTTTTTTTNTSHIDMKTTASATTTTTTTPLTKIEPSTFSYTPEYNSTIKIDDTSSETTILTSTITAAIPSSTISSVLNISEPYRKTEEIHNKLIAGNDGWKLVETVKPPEMASKATPPIMASTSKPTFRPIEAYQSTKVDLSTQGNYGMPALSEDMYMFSKMYNEIALKFWNALSMYDINAERSAVVSPFGAISMLAMIFLGARGGTSGEMNDVLKLDDIVTFNPHLVFKEITDSVVARRSPSAIVRELYSDSSKGKVLDFYKERVRYFYDGHVEEVDFKKIHNVIRRRTNSLISKQTRGQMPQYLEETTLSLRAPMSTLSTNIFQADCSQASTEGRDGEFYFIVLPSIRQRRLVPIPAAVWRAGFIAGYDPELDATAVSLGTLSQPVSTIFVMPGQQGHSAPGDVLLRLEARLLNTTYIPETWNQLLKSMLPRPGLEIQLPRFLHKSVINTTEALKRMGLTEMFNRNKASFQGLNGIRHDLYLSDMMQVNEFSICGENQQMHTEMYPSVTEHLANHNEQMRNFKYVDYFEENEYDKYLSIPLPLRPRQARLPEVPKLRFDRPFLYFVRHNPTGLILHMGRFNPRLLT